MRRLLAGLLLSFCVTVAGAEPIPLVLDPAAPLAFEPVMLTAASPLDDEGHAMIEVGSSNLWEDIVEVDDGWVHVSSYSRRRPPGSVVQHAFVPLEHTIELGILAPGDYTVEFDLYGDADVLLGSGTTSATVTPEPAGAVIAAVGGALGLAVRRRRSPR